MIRTLQPIVDVGLEYVRLGQPVPTLSGGEAQRLKLAGFLAEAAQGKSASRQPVAKKGRLFLFDEPTTGLHFDDIAKLMRAFRKLLEGGDSIVVIEHNLDVVRASDWLIDLGPEGGEAAAAGGVRRSARGSQAPSHIAHGAGLARVRHRDGFRGAGGGRAGRADVLSMVQAGHARGCSRRCHPHRQCA